MLFQATVLLSMPHISAVIAKPLSTHEYLGDNIVVYISRNSTEYGASVSIAPPDGSSILCWTDKSKPREYAYYIQTLNAVDDSNTDPFEHRKLLNVDSKDANGCNAHLELAKKLLGKYKAGTLISRAHRADVDELPGDVNIGHGSTGIRVSEDITVVSGSPMAQIALSADNSRVETVGAELISDTPISESVHGPDFVVENVAANKMEAMGGLTVHTVTADASGRMTSSPALPLFRMQRIAGGTVDGITQSVLSAPPTPTHTDSTQPSLLATDTMRLNGDTMKASSSSVGSFKTPFVPGVLQTIYDGAGKTELRTGSKQHTAEDAPFVPLTEAEITDAALNKLLDGLLDSGYSESLKRALYNKGFTEADSSVTVGGIGIEIPAGPAGEAYQKPKSTVVTDPETGKKTEYFGTSSFITQEPDGSICLCDGYGSEIRMSRGNIYISPALDLFLRPGRDISVMAGRHQAYNSQDTCTINTSSSLYVRALDHIKIAADATGPMGTKNTGGAWSPSIIVDAYGGGLSCYSEGDAILSAVRDIALVRRAKDPKPTPPTTTEDPATQQARAQKELIESATSAPVPGVIRIDSGVSGHIHMRGRSTILNSDSTAVTATTSSRVGSGITIQNSAITLNAPNVSVGGALTVAASTGAMSNIVTNAASGKNMYDVAPFTFVGGSGTLNVEGPMLKCAGIGEFMAGVRCASVQQSSEHCAIGYTASGLTPMSAPPYDGVGFSTCVAGSKTTDKIWVTCSHFSYPVDYGVILTRMPGMVWQERSAFVGLGKKWKESYCTNPYGIPTACYPGYAVWESAVISKRNLAFDRLATGYVTNSL